MYGELTAIWIQPVLAKLAGGQMSIIALRDVLGGSLNCYR